MPDRIQLPGLDDSAFLEAVGNGKVMPNGAGWTLSGTFLLEVFGQRSRPVDFDTLAKKVEVILKGEKYLLGNCGSTNFTFQPELTLQDSPTSPWLKCSLASLAHRNTASTVRLSLDDVAMSLVPDAPLTKRSSLTYPRHTGSDQLALAKSAHPEAPTEGGFFVLPHGGGLGVALGSPVKLVEINHAKALSLRFAPGKSQMWFSGGANRVAFSATATQPQGLQFLATRATGLARADNPGSIKWKDCTLDVDRLEAAGDTLTVTAFSSAEVMIARATGSASGTGVYTHTRRLQFELGLLPQADLGRQLPPAELLYLDADARKSMPVSGRERYYGVRIAGVGTTAGVLAALDADLALFRLQGGIASAEFHFMAGVPRRPGEAPMLLVPKQSANGGDRVLTIPARELSLEVRSSAAPHETAIAVDTRKAQGSIHILAPRLLGAPIGVSSRAAAGLALDKQEFAHWRLALPATHAGLEFDAGAAGLIPVKGLAWPSEFGTEDPNAQYGFVEHPGGGVQIDPPLPTRLMGKVAQSAPTGFQYKPASSGKETMVYSAFTAALLYTGVRYAQDGASVVDPERFHVEFAKIEEKEIYKDIRSGSLLVAMSHGQPGAQTGLRKLIDDNRARSQKPTAPTFLWPFTMGLHMLLLADNKYADDIAITRRPAATPAIGIDLSKTETLDPTWFGWKSWKVLADEDPVLWPRGSGRIGARLDPSDRQWRGIFFRELPLTLPPLPPVVGQEAGWVAKLVEEVNAGLMLDYGWKDESGFTWKGGWSPPANQTEKKIEIASWDGVFELYLGKVNLSGAADMVVGAEATGRIALPLIKDKAGDALSLGGKFSINLGEGDAIKRIEFSGNKPIETSSIPGFKEVALARVATDLKSAQVDLLLTASPELAKVLPFLSEKPQAATLGFNLSGKPSMNLTLAMPEEKETNLFGRWPFKVQAIHLDIDDDETELRLVGRLNFGVGSFASIGAEIIVRKNDGKADLEFDIRIQQFSADFSLGDMRCKALISWGMPGTPSQTTLAGAGATSQRDFFGYFELEKGGVVDLGRNRLCVRLSNQGEMNFWVAYLEVQQTIHLGTASLKEPGLLLAHNADFGTGLRKMMTDPSGDVAATLRPPADVWKWLNDWKPSSEIGTVVAGSGYFELNSLLAAAPDPKPENLSTLVLTNSGLMRIEGFSRLLSALPMKFTIGINTRDKYLLVGLQLPDAALGAYVFQSGFLTIGFSYSDEPYLDFRIGWPDPLTGGKPLERDWNKAVKVKATTLPPPINTAWGGFRATLSSAGITLGVALRAGWTDKSGDVSGGSGGGYNIGITIGAVLLFDLPFSIAALPAGIVGASGRALSPDALAAAHAAADDAADMLERYVALIDPRMYGEIIGDVWGSAWLKFMGITLASINLRAYAVFSVCGKLSGLQRSEAHCGFSVSVTILCVTYSTDAAYDVVLKDGTCSIGPFHEMREILESHFRPALPLITELAA